MAKTKGGIRKKLIGRKIIAPKNDANYTGSVTNIEPLRNIKDTKLRLDVQQGISKFESRLGVRQRKVVLADLSGAMGVHVSENGKSSMIALNKAYFKDAAGFKRITESKKQAYKDSFLTKTNKPTQHTVVHELGHALWNSHLSGEKYRKAGVEIEKVRSAWMKAAAGNNSLRKNWGKYSTENVNEFFAEGITKHTLGNADPYTTRLKRIVKKYKL